MIEKVDRLQAVSPIRCYWRRCNAKVSIRVQTTIGVSYYCEEHSKKAIRLARGSDR